MVGIGVPSVVEFETGRIVSSVNVPLADLPLRQLLSERLGVPVLTVHHRTYARLGRERRSDVQLLCWRCHQLVQRKWWA